MKCLVLGGGGFLGSHLSDALIDLGYSVRIFDRPNLLPVDIDARNPKAEWMEGDFANKEDVSKAVQGVDIIYHLISTTIPKSSVENPVYDIETNVLSTIHLLECACRALVKKIIFISSGGTVYGLPQQLPIPETHPTYPICSYGVCKLTIEKYLHLYKTLYGIDYCILRLSNPYGERQLPTRAQGVIAVFLHKAIRNEPIEIWGDGRVVRDYFHVSDAVSAMVKAISCSIDGAVFNIGSGKGLSLNEVVDHIETVAGQGVCRKYLPGRPFDVSANILDIEKAGCFLNWKPAVPLSQGLRRTLNWMKNLPSIGGWI